MKEIEEIKDRLCEWTNGKQEGHERGVLMIAYDFDGEQIEITSMMDASKILMTSAICLQAEDHKTLSNIVINAGRAMLEKKQNKAIEVISRDIKNEDK
jgi:hypothetical protein